MLAGLKHQHAYRQTTNDAIANRKVLGSSKAANRELRNQCAAARQICSASLPFSRGYITSTPGPEHGNRPALGVATMRRGMDPAGQPTLNNDESMGRKVAGKPFDIPTPYGVGCRVPTAILGFANIGFANIDLSPRKYKHMGDG
jgi:hypothetical protein